ncbi:Basic helix-loop-helix transcription factor [Trema orientale]|uniref:Basic helix-loop-helix transcription factor n=1 Tax=Trema orientale TaxID=63057 RepID=A0A2P5DKK4_TREOI|nr:Basic helix-loop-helix transcription factor [Trema orientale]
MASYSFSNSSYGSDYSSLFDPFPHGPGGFSGVLRGGSVVPHSLVLDSKRGELVKAPARVGKKGVSEAKALAALKNHSEAERRRRERINAHLATLRSLVPCNEKMDKATLLAEVISQVKELKKNAAEASQGLLIPEDKDEVQIEPYYDNGEGNANFLFKAYLCCGYRPELLTDVRQALDALPLKMVRTEISTLGDRLKISFVFTCFNENNNDAETCRTLASSVQETLSSVLDKASALAEYSPRTTLPCKRRRISYFDSSSSSS